MPGLPLLKEKGTASESKQHVAGSQTARDEASKKANDLQPRQPNTARTARSNPRRQQSSGGPNGGAASTSKRRRPKTPMTPAEAIKQCKDKLTSFEVSEILEYHNVYFCGNDSAKKIQGRPHAECNNKYDDERGDYKLVPGDHMEYRYEVLHMLGRGSFGQVVKVIDHKKDYVVALKVIRNKKRFHHQALVEVKILEHLMNKDKDHKSNIVRVFGYFYFRNHLCITFEALSMNLYEFIKVNNFKGFSVALIKRFAVQLLKSLALLQEQKIIHCDLKPENILLKNPNKSTIKLIDFGSSCFEPERIYTYIQSRFYRSPEVILGLPYDISIDMWSFGCILAELYTGYPLFPGENEMEQMACIMEIMGAPPKRMSDASTRQDTFFEGKKDKSLKPKLVKNSRGKVRGVGTTSLAKAVPCDDDKFISFLKKCLRWDPKKRYTPKEALRDPWIDENVGRGTPRLEEDKEASKSKKKVQTRSVDKAAAIQFPPIQGKADAKKKLSSQRYSTNINM